ncbi:MAG: hypothetical protein ABJA64_03065, partial [Candidatus Saccharibacteria bacterium]
MKYTKKDQRGAVSLFIVVFSALLVTVVTVGFIQIMLRNQQEATTADLSQSAYDSALAGVEDAKRVLVAGATLDPNACDSVAKALDASSAGDETKIQQSEGDKALSQAYTCVKVERDTDDFAGKGLGGEQQSVVIPLKGQTAFNKVEISWGLADADQTATLPPAGT